jgi:hypothetical protein
MKQELINKIEEMESAVNEDGRLMQIAERYLDDHNLNIFAERLSLINSALNDLKKIFKNVAANISENEIEEMGAVAQAFDESGDPLLQKQASVIDEILLTIGADPKAQMAFKKAQEDEIERLRAKYKNVNNDQYTKAREQEQKEIKVNEAIKDIDEKIKKYRPMEASLSSRYSPDMPGVSLVRIGDSVWQCPITKKIYDFKNGYTTSKGNIVPGTDVSNQTQNLGFRGQEHMMFSTREGTLNGR